MVQRPGLEITSDLSELKFIDEGGEEYDAKLVLHDEVLGLAFLALDPAGENAKSFKSPAIDLSQDVEVAHLEELIAIGRLPESLRFQAQVKTGAVTAIVKKPRTLIQIGQIGASNPIFNQSGAAVGFMVVPKSTQPGMPVGPVLLPNKYLRDLIVQAKEKQAELAADGEEKKG